MNTLSMNNYDKFYKHYDAVTGDQRQKAAFLESLIRRQHPRARTLLELACGTGAVLLHLALKFDAAGLDLSRGMLRVAKKRLPHTPLYRQDMTHFKVPGKFDAILCVYDSINHLADFRDWQRVFAGARKHLNENGVFILDVNPEHILKSMARWPAQIHKCGRDYIVMKLMEQPQGLMNCNIKVFEHVGGNRFRLYEENIQEKAFPIGKIKSALGQYFKRVIAIDGKGKRPNNKTPKIFFVCQI